MNPVSDTAFYTCGIREQDAKSAKPVCNDRYAARFMNARGAEVYSMFSGDKMGSNAHLARHSMIDELVRAQVAADPDTCVVTIGAGFDSRPYRIKGGAWIELDEPGIVEYKNERLAAADCKNALRRISIDFSRESLHDKLPRLVPASKLVVVIEGVFFYLTEEQINATLDALQHAYPGHVLICDLMTRHVIESRYRKNHQKLQQMNAPFKFLADAPWETFTRTGYRLGSEASILKRTFELTWNKRLASILGWFMPKVVNGYKIFTFEAPSKTKG